MPAYEPYRAAWPEEAAPFDKGSREVAVHLADDAIGTPGISTELGVRGNEVFESNPAARVSEAIQEPRDVFAQPERERLRA